MSSLTMWTPSDVRQPEWIRRILSISSRIIRRSTRLTRIHHSYRRHLWVIQALVMRKTLRLPPSIPPFLLMNTSRNGFGQTLGLSS